MDVDGLKNMVKFRYLTEFERNNVIIAYKNGIPIKYIAQYHNIHVSTIYRIVNNESKLRINVGGRRRNTSSRCDSYIRTILKKNMMKSIKEIQRTLLPEFSYDLIRRRMREANMKLVSPRVKPTLRKAQRNQRLRFVNENKNRPQSFWRSIYFADECMIREEPWAFKKKAIGGDYLPKSRIPTIRKSTHPSQLMCWFAIKYNESIRWCPIDSTLNSDKFVDVINFSFADRLKSRASGKVIILQDNAPCHVSTKVNLFRQLD